MAGLWRVAIECDGSSANVELCERERQRENKRTGVNRSQWCLQHCGPYGDAASSPESFLCLWRPYWVRLDHIFVTKSRLNQVKDHRLYWGSGGAHRKTSWATTYDDDTQLIAHLTIKRNIKCCDSRVQNCIKAIQAWCNSKTTSSESNKDRVDLVRIQDESWCGWYQFEFVFRTRQYQAGQFGLRSWSLLIYIHEICIIYCIIIDKTATL